MNQTRNQMRMLPANWILQSHLEIISRLKRTVWTQINKVLISSKSFLPRSAEHHLSCMAVGFLAVASSCSQEWIVTVTVTGWYSVAQVVGLQRNQTQPRAISCRQATSSFKRAREMLDSWGTLNCLVSRSFRKTSAACGPTNSEALRTRASGMWASEHTAALAWGYGWGHPSAH